MKADTTVTVDVETGSEFERLVREGRRAAMLRVIVFAIVAGLSAGLVSAALSGCAAPTAAQRQKTIDGMSKGVAVAADVAARAASAIEKWATARESELARSAPSREVGEQQLRAFERQMARVDQAVAVASLAIEAAALAVAGLAAADDANWIVAAASVKAAFDAVRQLQAAIADVKL